MRCVHANCAKIMYLRVISKDTKVCESRRDEKAHRGTIDKLRDAIDVVAYSTLVAEAVFHKYVALGLHSSSSKTHVYTRTVRRLHCLHRRTKDEQD